MKLLLFHMYRDRLWDEYALIIRQEIEKEIKGLSGL